MYVRAISIGKFRHLENVKLGPFVPPNKDSDLICFAGPNGSGKSSILELIGYALSQYYSLAWNLNRSFPDSSFEVSLGVTKSEVDLIEAILNEDQKETYKEAISHLRKNFYYWRGFKYEDGEYAKDQRLHNRIHEIATQSLKNHYQRSLGFFLKSDRAYTARNFDQRKIFQYQQIRQLEHVWSTAFNTSEAQYTDIFDFLVQQRYHYFNDLGKYYHTNDKTKTPPEDPLLVYNKLLSTLFDDYSFSEKDEGVPSNLYIKIRGLYT